MYTQILLLGGNQNDVIDSMQKAIEGLSYRLGSPIKASAYYESEPWGFAAEQNFINQVVEFSSPLSPIDLLDLTQKTEMELGRKAKTGTHYESRPIDIDILFIDSMEINSSRLTVPHPRLHKRRFTLLPLMDHWSGLLHPTMNKSIKQLLNACTDSGTVKKVVL